MAFDAIMGWFGKTFAPLVSDIIVAVVLLLIGIVITKIIERVVAKVLHELELNKWLKKAGVHFALEETIAAVVRYFLYFLVVVLALNQVGLTTTVLNIVALAIILLIVAALILGIKDFIPNFVAGIRVHRRGRVNVGDTIRIREIQGTVKEINLLDTRIQSAAGDVIFIPNSMLMKEAVFRYSRSKKKYTKSKKK
jgi:small conductance mechanosensitive channel